MRYLRLAVVMFGLVSLGLFVHATTGDIYSETANAKADIRAALAKAAKTHRRVILDFGGNWCADCKVLDMYLHNAQNQQLLEQNYVLVHISVGHYDKNLDLAEKYLIPLKKGVPALAILDAQGTLLSSQRTGEFETMRLMNPSAVTAFLVKWKPGAKTAPCNMVMTKC